MSVIMGLLAVSALAGLVLGFYFGLAAIVVSGLILAISAAAILQNIDFGSLEGIAIIVLCLTVNQIAYFDWTHAGEPRSEERYPVTNLTMIQAIVATRTLPANTSSSKRTRCALFQRANDGGPFRQVLRKRWRSFSPGTALGAIVAVPVNLVQRGRMLLVPRLEDFRTSTIGWKRGRMLLVPHL